MNIQLANYFVMIVVGGGAYSVTCPVSKAISIYYRSLYHILSVRDCCGMEQ